jgi:hypothetical protein
MESVIASGQENPRRFHGLAAPRTPQPPRVAISTFLGMDRPGGPERHTAIDCGEAVSRTTIALKSGES